MSEDKTVKQVQKSIHDTVKDARDAVHETMHRSTAEAERVRREVDGDEMTTGEKIASGVNEAKNRVQAEIDEAKRKAR